MDWQCKKEASGIGLQEEPHPQLISASGRTQPLHIVAYTSAIKNYSPTCQLSQSLDFVPWTTLHIGKREICMLRGFLWAFVSLVAQQLGLVWRIIIWG
jgi:hypothetical protein